MNALASEVCKNVGKTKTQSKQRNNTCMIIRCKCMREKQNADKKENLVQEEVSERERAKT